MKKLWWAASAAFVSGCGTVEPAVRGTVDAVFGGPTSPEAAIAPVAAVLPEPWNIVVTGLGGAIIGVGAWLYRRRLLKADPTKVD